MPVHQSSGRRGLGFALASATMVSWGILPVALSGILARLDAVTITAVRFVVSALVLSAALALSRSRPAVSHLPRSGLGLLGVATLFLAINYLTYILGLHHTTPADAQVLIQGAPLLLALSGVFVFREPFSRLQWVGFGVLVAGIAIFSAGRFGGPLPDPGRQLLGNGLIAVAAVTWAIYGMAQKQLLRAMPSQHVMLWVYLGCSLLFLPLSTPTALAGLDGTGWALLLFCALNTVVAYGSFAEALQHWEASRVSAVLAAVPLATLGFQRLCVWVWPAYDPGPPLDATAVAGACTVVAGSLLTSLGAPWCPGPGRRPEPSRPDAVSFPDPLEVAMAKRRSVVPDGMQGFYDQFHFSPAVRVGKNLYCSGQIGSGPEGKLDPDPAVQITQAFENVRAVLEEAGASLEDVVEMTSFHVGLNEHIGIFMQVKDGFLKEPYPAWTAVGVAELAFGAMVEIKVVARIGG